LGVLISKNPFSLRFFFAVSKVSIKSVYFDLECKYKLYFFGREMIHVILLNYNYNARNVEFISIKFAFILPV
jgi:hypothetical protein